MGAVYRGKDVIDGVVSHVSSSGLAEGIVDMLCGSKHYGQVRLILLDEKMLPEPVSPDTLWEHIGKPVLIFTKDGEIDPRYFFRYKEHTIRASGIDEDSAQRVLKKILKESGSESLRIADIILKNIARLHNV
ncbi:MAG: hypothetical protein NWF07_02945 [Candidatus Bathyarchaeota archaeon]|nr:hypothetical protein [Candidatus Bathyarchaeota archaeon]